VGLVSATHPAMALPHPPAEPSAAGAPRNQIACPGSHRTTRTPTAHTLPRSPASRGSFFEPSVLRVLDGGVGASVRSHGSGSPGCELELACFVVSGAEPLLRSYLAGHLSARLGEAEEALRWADALRRRRATQASQLLRLLGSRGFDADRYRAAVRRFAFTGNRDGSDEVARWHLRNWIRPDESELLPEVMDLVWETEIPPLRRA
jgi:hypothetical protein